MNLKTEECVSVIGNMKNDTIAFIRSSLSEDKELQLWLSQYHINFQLDCSWDYLEANPSVIILEMSTMICLPNLDI